MFLALIRLVGSIFWLLSGVRYMQTKNDELADTFVVVAASCFTLVAGLSFINTACYPPRRLTSLK